MHQSLLLIKGYTRYRVNSTVNAGHPTRATHYCRAAASAPISRAWETTMTRACRHRCLAPAATFAAPVTPATASASASASSSSSSSSSSSTSSPTLRRRFDRDPAASVSRYPTFDKRAGAAGTSICCSAPPRRTTPPQHCARGYHQTRATGAVPQSRSTQRSGDRSSKSCRAAARRAAAWAQAPHHSSRRGGAGR